MKTASDEIPLSEVAVVPDVVATGMLEPEEIGAGLYRLTFYVRQKSTIFLDRRPEHVIVNRVVLTRSMLRELATSADAALMTAPEPIGVRIGTTFN